MISAITSQNNIGEMLNKRGKYEEASRIFQHTLDERKGVLGSDHPDTLLIRHNMAVVIDKQGKYSEAFNIYQEVLGKQIDILGPDHPDTLKTRHNMEAVLSKQSKYSKAFRMFLGVLNITKIELGYNPSTLLTNSHIEQTTNTKSYW